MHCRPDESLDDPQLIWQRRPVVIFQAPDLLVGNTEGAQPNAKYRVERQLRRAKQTGRHVLLRDDDLVDEAFSDIAQIDRPWRGRYFARSTALRSAVRSGQ
jgi:hypothetical protein